jgi:hypothetical protein
MVKKIQIIVELEPYEPDAAYYDGETDINKMAEIDISGHARARISSEILNGEGKLSYHIVED